MRRKYLELVYHLLLHTDDAIEVVFRRKRQRRGDADVSLDCLLDELVRLSTISTPLAIQRTHNLSLNTMSDYQCAYMCRFERAHLIELADLLQLPEVIVTRYGTTCHRYIALPLFLFRLAHAHTWYNLERDFAPRQSSAREIFYHVLEHIWELFHHLLTGPNVVTTRAELLRSAAAISAKLGIPLPVVMGFVDGKLYEVDSPVYGQESIYNGKDRIHALKYQAALHACGLLMNFAGAYAGRRHDAFMWAESSFEELLNAVLQGVPLVLFGDSAYPRGPRMLKPYVGRILTAAQLAFNDRWCSGTWCIRMHDTDLHSSCLCGVDLRQDRCAMETYRPTEAIARSPQPRC